MSAVRDIHLATCVVDLLRRTVARNGTELALTSVEARLLGYLVENEGRDVSRDELLRVVWGYSPLSTSRAVDYTVFRLRSKLGEVPVPKHLFTVHGLGYRFVRLEHPPVVDRPTAPDIGEPSIALATGALDLVRSRFVARDGRIVALSKLETDVLSTLVDGRTVRRKDVIARAWGRGTHDRSLDALIRRLRLRMDDPDGVVIVTVRGQGLRLDLRAAGDPPPPRTNLVAASSRFQDRPELARLLTTTSRLVTLRGTAGIGKTRLAQEAGLAWLEASPEAAVWFCDLSSVGDAAGIARVVARVLAIELSGDAEPIAQLGRALAHRGRTTLVLDNFEHLLAHAAMVARWMDEAPATRFVTTSREALGLEGEVVVDLEPLAADAAYNLLAARVRDVRLPPHDPVVHALVARLDGLPLAIELAAARVGDLGPAELLRRIEERLDLLVRRPEQSLSHHPTLRGAFDSSWDLLSTRQRSAFARCSVFVSPFGREAARAVVGVDPAEELVGGLVVRSLIHVAPDGRWRLLESLRDYANEKLVLLEQRDEARGAHAAFYLALATEHERSLGVDAPRALDGLRAIRAELFAVLARARDADGRARAILALAPLSDVDGPSDSWLDLARAGAVPGLAPVLAWQMEACLSEAERRAGRPDWGCVHAERALAIARQVDEIAVAGASRQLWRSLYSAGRTAEAGPLLLAALEVYERVGDTVGAGRTLANLSRGAHALGALEEAERWFEAARVTLEGTGDTQSLATLYSYWGSVRLECGDLAGARSYVERSHDLVVRQRDRWNEHATLIRLASIARAEGDFDRADHLLERCRVEFGRGGTPDETHSLAARALLAAERGDLRSALRMAQRAAELPSKGVLSRCVQRTNLALVHHLMGRVEEAHLGFEQIEADLRSAGAVALMVIVMGHRAMALADLDRPTEAEAVVARARELVTAAARGWRMFLGLCDAVVALARARAGTCTSEAALALVHARIEESQEPTTAGPCLAALDQDVSLALRILERAMGVDERAAGISPAPTPSPQPVSNVTPRR